ncbi:M20 family metallopeptidase [Natronincola ferrireducens]|uniref:Peptidase M20 domain-containing protein 2 n=1 Tax=Natronincola ferrireducens TaxID=393762 RepID=A0A1G9E4D4_9FIRM|nr:M20 family metallopeptidase [Natronincola ferrireducens]SDK70953.1 amidohydrolase [Natronincola ferrireducens]
MDIDQYKERVIRKVDEISKDLFEVSDYIYNHPEYCFEEYLATKKIIGYLENSGFKVQKGLGGLDTAFVATYDTGKPGNHIGLFGEYDAVKGMGHACGHNIMAATALGAGIAVKSVIDEIGGKVSVFGTPAEEGGGGKIIMLENNVFDGIDAAMILHPASDTVVNDISYSRTDIEVNFYGKTAHAATFPEEGISALNAVIQLFNMVNGMGLEVLEKGKIIGIISKGGEDPIYVPDHTQAKFTIRSFKMKYKEELVERFLEICKAVAKATKTTFKYKYIGLPYEDIRNNEKLEDLLAKNLILLGETICPRERELGIGCTDMGNVTHEIPGLQSYIQIAEGTRGHTPEFLEAAGDDRGRNALLKGAKAMGMTTIDLLASKDNMREVKEAFQKMKQRF